MKIIIPYNIYIFIWFIIGIIILSYDFIMQIGELTLSRLNFTIYSQIIWFLIFILYCVKYIKNLIKK
jgi:hypothetical protein